MRFRWTNIALIGGLCALLFTLGFLQYRWQTQIAENEGEKMHRSVKEDAARFAADFNREIQGAYFNFQVGADDWKAKKYNSFVERYEFWQSKTKYPDLISGFYFFNASADTPPLKYDPSSRTFLSQEWTDKLRDLRQRFSDQKDFRPVYADIYALVLPVNEAPEVLDRILDRRTPEFEKPVLEHVDGMHKPRNYGFLAIDLDRSVVTGQLLPDLAAQYFGDGEFNVSIAPKDGDPVFTSGAIASGRDAAIPLFSLSPADFVYFSNKELLSSLENKRSSGVVVNERFESRTSRVETANGQTVTVELKKGTQPRTSIITTAENGGAWTLNVQHVEGSIDEHLSNVKRRNLAVGFGVLALLGAAVGAIIVSAQRARMFAQRQVDFVSSVSHEFRTPLSVIYSAGENLADGVTNDRAQTASYGELIKGEGRKLSAMVEQILEFAGANSGRRKYHLRQTTISDVVREAVDECRPLLDENGFSVESDFDPALPTVNADSEALSRAIQNLIVNAVKYAHGDRWLRVSAQNGNDAVRISVEDRGIGIAKSELAKIFEPFYRSKSVVDAQIHGNGLGLALVKQIAEAHGGSVTAQSEVGKGSLFTINIPTN